MTDRNVKAVMGKHASLLILRGQCLATVEAIDKILGELPESLAADPAIQPLEVIGVCEKITAHAVTRYRERTGTKKGEVATLSRIRQRLEMADEWRLKEKFRLIELLAHGRESKIWKQGDMVFIVEDGVVITCHHGTADRWERMPKPEDGREG